MHSGEGAVKVAFNYMEHSEGYLGPEWRKLIKVSDSIHTKGENLLPRRMLQRLFGVVLILVAIALFYATFATYWFSSDATIIGRIANMAIPLLVLFPGLFFLVTGRQIGFDEE